MTVDILHSERDSERAGRGQVAALHCSGAGAGQWNTLAQALGRGYELVAPEHYGCGSTGPWTGTHAFTLADEAARTLEWIDAREGKVHLVGHSYGGGVALHVALARPHRIAGLALYEPSAFHLLPRLGGEGAEAFAEITGVARHVARGIVTGDYQGAVAGFVDYWNGPGAWEALRPAVQDALVRWAPKAPLDFRALIEDPTPAAAYRTLQFPVLVLRGQHAPAPTRVIAEGLSELVPDGRLAVVKGAGHMGPLTHASEVAGAIARHIAAVDTEVRSPSRWRPRTLGDIIGAVARPAEAAS
jgi:pimeloyl-ACP methyl ester carboxylesterase